MRAKAARSQQFEVVYSEDFSTGPGAWTTGKAAPDGDWHRNIFGERGKPTPLGWRRGGGRRGPFAFTQPPWYFDDNHGEFAWLYLTFFVNRSALIGLAGRDLRDAQVRLSLRGYKLGPKGTQLLFWIQGTPAPYSGQELRTVFNWALASQPIARELADGRWHDLRVTLANDESQWTFMGHLNGGLSRKIRVFQSLSAGAGTLDGILSGGHVNFGFLLCYVDPNDPPSGRIDIERVSILARA